MFEKKTKTYYLSCQCGLVKELGGDDRCPRCQNKMKKKKGIMPVNGTDSDEI